MRPHQSEIETIIKSGVEIADKFINQAIPCKLSGMNADLMTQYIKFQADAVIRMMNYQPIYNEINPFRWMESFDILDKKNFFEKKPTQYSTETNPANLVIDYSKMKSALEEFMFEI